MSLKVQNSCEIEALIDEIVKISNKNYSEVEKTLFKVGIYPESTKTFITKQFGNILTDLNQEIQWLEDALQEVFKTSGINEIYVTSEI